MPETMLCYSPAPPRPSQSRAVSQVKDFLVRPALFFFCRATILLLEDPLSRTSLVCYLCLLTAFSSFHWIFPAHDTVADTFTTTFTANTINSTYYQHSVIRHFVTDKMFSKNNTTPFSLQIGFVADYDCSLDGSFITVFLLQMYNLSHPIYIVKSTSKSKNAYKTIQNINNLLPSYVYNEK